MLINYEGVGILQVCDACGTVLTSNNVVDGAFCPRPICHLFYKRVEWQKVEGELLVSPNNTPTMIQLKKKALFFPIAIHLHNVSRGTHAAYLGV